jgi:hypothetical protein
MLLSRLLRSATLAALLPFAGCSHRVPDSTVILIDTSLSITPRAEKAALDAVRGRIARMKRGDHLVLIPITGDEANDAGGRILRLSTPAGRESYDADLRRFRAQADSQFATWTQSLDPHQSRTDIFGGIAAAEQDLTAQPKDNTTRLVVVSDFLEDDATHHFVSDGALANPARALHLAALERTRHPIAFHGAHLCLGRLESRDFVRLSLDRQNAVQAFWAAYFGQGGQPAEENFDGTGMLADAGSGCLGGL